MKTNPHIYPASVLPEGNAGFFVPDSRKEITMSNPQSPLPQAKVTPCSCRLCKVGPQAVLRKIILAALRYFPQKPCTAGTFEACGSEPCGFIIHNHKNKNHESE